MSEAHGEQDGTGPYQPLIPEFESDLSEGKSEGNLLVKSCFNPVQILAPIASASPHADTGAQMAALLPHHAPGPLREGCS